jgi:hypothetical protein
MKKQTDFDVRVFQINRNPEAHGGMNHLQVSQMVRDEYLSQGWDVLSSENISFDGNNVFVQVSLVKWEDVPEVAEKRVTK